ncbi:MAG: hypothetical protein RJB50_1143 [Actinomycetota bacterium]
MSNLVWLVVIVVLVGFVALSYNSLVQRRNQVKNAWSQIDVQLKRRIELIPNLVETQQVIAARNVAMAAPSTVADQAGADNALSGRAPLQSKPALTTLFRVRCDSCLRYLSRIQT